jgi:CubicO group peptidase (beta-lactamase class C family)
MVTLRFGEALEAGISPERLKHVKDLCASWVADESTPALIALVARHGIIFLYEAWGRLGPDPHSSSVLPDSIFGVASVSKPVTATAIMILVERGQIGLNQPVLKYVPEFEGDGFEQVTLRHLLTHTSGLPYNSDIPFADLGRSGLRLSPGREMRYSNVGFELLGELVARVSMQPFHEFTRCNIFEPIGMKDATFVHYGKEGERCMQPWPGTKFDWPDEVQGKTFPSSTLCAPAMDLAIFGQTFLNMGTYGNCRLLSPPTVAAMTRNQIPGIPRELRDGIAAPPFGFGWKMMSELEVPHSPSLLSPQSYGHTGASGTILWVDPTFDLVGILFCARLSDEFWPMDLFIDSIMGTIDQ